MVAGNEIILVETRPCFRDPTQWTRLPAALTFLPAG